MAAIVAASVAAWSLLNTALDSRERTRPMVTAEPTPDEVTVFLEYGSTRRKRFTDEFSLSVDTVKLTTYSVSSISIKGRLKTIEGALKESAAALKTIAGKI